MAQYFHYAPRRNKFYLSNRAVQSITNPKYLWTLKVMPFPSRFIGVKQKALFYRRYHSIKSAFLENDCMWSIVMDDSISAWLFTFLIVVKGIWLKRQSLLLCKAFNLYKVIQK